MECSICMDSKEPEEMKFLICLHSLCNICYNRVLDSSNVEQAFLQVIS